MKNYTLEQIGILGLIGGFVGLVLGEMYSNIIGGLELHILNMIIYAAVGVAVGYFASKIKKKRLKQSLCNFKTYIINKDN